MQLKCFGGPFDGKYQSIDENRAKQNEIFRFPYTSKVSIAEFNPNDNVSLTATLNHYFYVVETVRCKEERFIFLRYNETSIEDTFAKIFK